MTVLEVSILLVAIVNAVLLGAVAVLLVRVLKLVDTTQNLVVERARPVIDKIGQIADNVKDISMDVRQVEQRVASVTTRVIDQVEPPVRHFAALLAGVRAGVGRIFDAGQENNGNQGYAVASQSMRKE